MSGFDLVFALFGLVLGLAITEVLAGFSRVLKVRGRVRVGWLTPLLGLVVLLDLTSFWSTAWELREVLPGNLLTLFVVLAIVGAYYLIATLIFPDDPEAWPDFDAYYDRFNRKVLGGMLAVNLAWLVAGATAFAVAAKPGAEDDPIGLWSTLFELAPLPLIVALIVITSRRVNIALMLLLIADFVAQAIAEAV